MNTSNLPLTKGGAFVNAFQARSVSTQHQVLPEGGILRQHIRPVFLRSETQKLSETKREHFLVLLILDLLCCAILLISGHTSVKTTRFSVHWTGLDRRYPLFYTFAKKPKKFLKCFRKRFSRQSLAKHFRA